MPGASNGLTCAIQPGSASGGLLFDIQALGALTLTGFSWLMPATYTGSAKSFPVQARPGCRQDAAAQTPPLCVCSMLLLLLLLSTHSCLWG